MPLLALNTAIQQHMRIRYQFALGILPIGFMCASILATLRFSSWLGATLGIPPDSPVKEHPNGTLWFALFLGAMLLFMLLGYALGWVANAAFGSLLFGWPLSKVRAVHLQSAVPTHWLYGGASLDARGRALARWEEQRKGGLVRFMFTRGVLGCGVPWLLAMYVVPTLTKGRAITIRGALLSLLLGSAVGAGLSAMAWFRSESNYRKLTPQR